MVMQEHEKCAFLETFDLPFNHQKTGSGDNLHFSRESLYELGRRYFKAFTEII